MKYSQDRVDWILKAGFNVAKTNEIKDRISYDTGQYDHYCEPGYSLEEGQSIFISNWNNETKYNQETNKYVTIDDTMPRIANLLEKCGHELEWGDEWEVCNNCEGIFRTSPNGYGWKPNYHEWSDDEATCAECIKEHFVSDYLDELEGNWKSCMTFDVDLNEYSYIKIDINFESGFHPGQNDSPENIAKTLSKNNIERFLFTLDDVGQFDTSFSVWIHSDEFEDNNLTMEQVEKILNGVPEGPNIAENAKKALKEASLKSKELSGDGIIYSEIDVSTGTSKTRIVSPEEFIKGIKD